MVRKMSTVDSIAWRKLYKNRLNQLRGVVIQATFDAKAGHISEVECEEIISTVNEEVKTVVECERLINLLRKGD